MGLYHVGDRVVVRSDLATGKRYYMTDSYHHDVCTFEMTKLAGKTVTISKIMWDGSYMLFESVWHWTDEMFDGLEESVCELPSVGDLI